MSEAIAYLLGVAGGVVLLVSLQLWRDRRRPRPPVPLLVLRRGESDATLPTRADVRAALPVEWCGKIEGARRN